jgi:uncharacterized membrane protein YqjE
MDYPGSDDGSSVGRLVSDMARDVGTLFRQELDLAKCELAEKAAEAKKGATTLAVGAGMALGGALVLAAALVLGLTVLLRTWLDPLLAACVSAFAIGAILGVVGVVLVRRGGEDLSPGHFVPQRTLDSLKENTRWAKDQI